MKLTPWSKGILLFPSPDDPSDGQKPRTSPSASPSRPEKLPTQSEPSPTDPSLPADRWRQIRALTRQRELAEAQLQSLLALEGDLERLFEVSLNPDYHHPALGFRLVRASREQARSPSLAWGLADLMLALLPLLGPGQARAVTVADLRAWGHLRKVQARRTLAELDAALETLDRVREAAEQGSGDIQLALELRLEEGWILLEQGCLADARRRLARGRRPLLYLEDWEAVAATRILSALALAETQGWPRRQLTEHLRSHLKNEAATRNLLRALGDAYEAADLFRAGRALARFRPGLRDAFQKPAP